jgi:ketol-acid reductoisomerase
VDLFYQGGLNYMRYSVSDTAEHGDYVSGNRIVNEETKYEMSQILKEIQDGTYAQGWIDENEAGRPWFNEKRRQEQDHMIERVGAELRELMPFIDPVTVKPGE